MSDLLKNFDLAGDALHVLLVVNLFFLQDFDSHLTATVSKSKLLFRLSGHAIPA